MGSDCGLEESRTRLKVMHQVVQDHEIWMRPLGASAELETRACVEPEQLEKDLIILVSV